MDIILIGFLISTMKVFEHSNNIWKTEGIELRRYPNVIFYLLAVLYK